MKESIKRAMSPERAREVKRAGHFKEEVFARLINGHTNTDSNTSKADVIDGSNRKYSVKSGKFWQVFLYGGERLESNTGWKNVGDLSDAMTACLNVFPEKFEDYQVEKLNVKQDLQFYMRRLLKEVGKPEIFSEFLEKSIFNGENVDFLAINQQPRNIAADQMIFHLFHKEDVVDSISNNITLANSKARKTGDMDDQKVILISRAHRKNLGELELRNDSPKHYREFMFKLNGELVTDLLINEIQSPEPDYINSQLVIYGRAIAELSNDLKYENDIYNETKNVNESITKNDMENVNDYDNDVSSYRPRF